MCVRARRMDGWICGARVCVGLFNMSEEGGFLEFVINCEGKFSWELGVF